ncbi:MAG: NADP oxidoreductase [Candidatus Margulisiibacteriota bacterium]
MSLGSSERPLRVAIIGAGPSGFYVADALFRSALTVHIDAFDRLPTPFGLLRGGVAPDHQQMKTVGKYYERVAGSKPGCFQFFGNVKIGQDLSVSELQQCYDAIVFTCGAETDKRLGIPGEDLLGSHTATEFVGWYNGHPDYQTRQFDLSQPSIAIIGQGNVAIDVTRILAKTPAELKDSDITEHALKSLAQSSIKEIHLIGRRGPVQAAFTELEIKELGELEDCDVVVNPADVVLSEADQAELDDPANNKARKNYAILKGFAERPRKTGVSKTIFVRFLESPLEIKGEGHVQHLTLEKNKLTGAAGSQKASGTGEKTDLPCGLVFRSVGYRGVAIAGVPFDDKRGIFPNEGGRIVENGLPVPGFYVSGWIKRGPSGVLGSNKPDGTATVEALLADVASLKPAPSPSTDTMTALLSGRNVRTVSWEDWKKIDAEEVARGQALGKPREKFVSAEEVFAFLDRVQVGA